MPTLCGYCAKRNCIFIPILEHHNFGVCKKCEPIAQLYTNSFKLYMPELMLLIRFKVMASKYFVQCVEPVLKSLQLMTDSDMLDIMLFYHNYDNSSIFDRVRNDNNNEYNSIAR